MKAAPVLAILFIAFAFQACKKNNNDGGLICNGNGTASYFPLAVGDSRHFTTSNVETYDSITGQSGAYFYEVSVQPGYAPIYDTLMLAANGDVYDKNPAYPSQFLLVPGSPQLGEAWSYVDTSGKTYYERVINLKVSVLTYSCLYNNCMEIQDSLNNNNVEITYYAPGIGPVQSSFSVGPASTSELSGLILK